MFRSHIPRSPIPRLVRNHNRLIKFGRNPQVNQLDLLIVFIENYVPRLQVLVTDAHLAVQVSQCAQNLPSDFFEASPARTRVYKILNCHIEKEYKLGHLAFYEDDRTAEKLSTDSIFVLAHGRCSKYEYTVMNSRLGGQLRCSAPTARSKWSEEVLGDMCEKLELPIDTPRKKILQAWMEALDAADKEGDGHVHK